MDHATLSMAILIFQKLGQNSEHFSCKANEKLAENSP